MTGIWRLRAGVLVLMGALLVHQGRYALAPPPHDHALGGVHGYLTWLMPVAAALLFLVAAELAVRLADPEGRDGPRLPRGRALWIVGTGCLLTVFGVQESVETVVAHGHLPTLADVLGAGGWVTVPLAIAAGAAIALLLRGAASVLRWALSRAGSARRPRLALALVPRTPVLAPRGGVLARRLAGRAPPLLP